MAGTRLNWTEELERWLAPFLARLGHKARRRMCPLYLAGLIGPGDRKSVQPMAERLALGEYDQLHHFVSAGVWDAAPLEEELLIQADRLVGGGDAVLVIDDTALPKKGKHSVGVAPQYASALGKNANCQTLVSLTLGRGEVPVMVALRLFLPESWTSDRKRLERAGVPAGYRTARTKPEIALAEVDRVMAAGVRFGCVVADAGYGLSAPFRQGLTARGLAWAVGIPRSSESLSDRCEAHLSGCQSRPPPTAPHPGCPVDTGGRHAGERQMARSELASWDQGAVEGPLCRAPRPHRRRAAATNMGQGSATSSGRRSLAHRRTPDIGREEILPRQPPSWHGPARPGGHDQGAMGLRASPSAIERGTRPRSLRGTIVGRPSSSCAHDNDRLRLPPASPPHQRAAEKKESNGPPPQPSLPAVRHAIISLFIRSPPRRCPHCRTWIETLPRPK